MRPHIKITPAVVLASLALVVASGGSAYAATKIGSAEIRNNSIRSVDIKSNEIRSSDIESNQVRGADIKDGTLRAKDFAPGTLRTGPKGATGKPGAQGPAGAGRWLLVDGAGAIVAQSGGFSVASAYDAPGTPLGAVGNVYINANEDLSNNGITASIALQNQADQNADGITNGRSLNPDANPEFSGEITSTICSVASIVACAPAGTNNRSHFVVSPRLSDGQVTQSTNRKRFYVIITGDSTDFVAPSPEIPAVALP